MTYNKLPYTTSTISNAFSISPQGRIGLARVFTTMNEIGPGSRARLYLEDSKNSMVIEFTDAEDDTAYPIAFTKQSGGFINAKKFFQLGHIDLESLGKRYPFKQVPGKSVGLPNAKSDVFEVDLAHPITTADAAR